jgi:hypothetical protein
MKLILNEGKLGWSYALCRKVIVIIKALMKIWNVFCLEVCADLSRPTGRLTVVGQP